MSFICPRESTDSTLLWLPSSFPFSHATLVGEHLPGLGTGLRQLSRMVKSRYRSAAKDDGTRTVEIAEYVSGEEVQVNRISIWYFDGISYIYAPH